MHASRMLTRCTGNVAHSCGFRQVSYTEDRLTMLKRFCANKASKGTDRSIGGGKAAKDNSSVLGKRSNAAAFSSMLKGLEVR